MTNSENVVRKFVDCINRHDGAALLHLCSDQHCLVDGLGQVVSGREKLREAWSGYFEVFPDYHIEVETLLSSGRTVMLAGEASGTLASKASWRIPAAWRATVRSNRIDLWQVYADNKPVYELLSRSG